MTAIWQYLTLTVLPAIGMVYGAWLLYRLARRAHRWVKR